MTNQLVQQALADIRSPFDASVEFTATDVCRSKGWAMRTANRTLLDQTRAGRLIRRKVIDGYRRYYAYRVARETQDE